MNKISSNIVLKALLTINIIIAILFVVFIVIQTFGNFGYEFIDTDIIMQFLIALLFTIPAVSVVISIAYVGYNYLFNHFHKTN